ncbi:hypothetical protein Ddc_18359 [Ditylenchus destructor]|nr:hypothetical protein Ddc_18359 [Ditylenchus destructor]
MAHYRLYIAQPDLQLANKGALGKKIMKLYEFYQDLYPSQEKMSAAQKQLVNKKMDVLIPLKGKDGKEIEQIQPCEHHKEIMELLQKQEFSEESRKGFILNGDVDLDILVSLFKVNDGKIVVELQYETEGNVRTEDIKVGNVLWAHAEKKQDNVADITELKVAEIAIKLLLGYYERFYWNNIQQFQADCMFKNNCELTVLSSVFDKNGLSNAASNIHDLHKIIKKDNKNNIVKINNPPQLSATEMLRRNLLNAAPYIAAIAIRAAEENERRRRSMNSRKNDSVRYHNAYTMGFRDTNF